MAQLAKRTVIKNWNEYTWEVRQRGSRSAELYFLAGQLEWLPCIECLDQSLGSLCARAFNYLCLCLALQISVCVCVSVCLSRWRPREVPSSAYSTRNTNRGIDECAQPLKHIPLFFHHHKEQSQKECGELKTWRCYHSRVRLKRLTTLNVTC